MITSVVPNHAAEKTKQPFHDIFVVNGFDRRNWKDEFERGKEKVAAALIQRPGLRVALESTGCGLISSTLCRRRYGSVVSLSNWKE